MKKTNSIKELPKNERPREKIKKYGIESLTNEEILIILIGSGNKYSDARDLSFKILSSVSEMSDLVNLNYEALSKIKGLGPSKISIILAAIELSKRVKKKELVNTKIDSSKKVFDYFKTIFIEEMQVFLCRLS